MIDLRNKDLPNAIQADGKSFLIQTDFRFWLNFGANLDKDNPEKIIAVIPDLFIDDLPEPSEEVINKLENIQKYVMNLLSNYKEDQ